MDASSAAAAAAAAGAGAGARAQKGGKRKAAKGARAASKYTADDVLRIVRRIAAELVQATESLPDSVSLTECGLDSLGATELSGKLSGAFGIKLLPTLIFSYPTISEIANHIISLVGVEVEAADELDGVAEEGTGATIPARNPVDRAAGCAVAMLGMSCRLPGDINTVDDLWTALLSGEDKISEVSLNRWDTDAIISMLDVDSATVDRIRYGGFLSDEVVSSFDPAQFGITQTEAKHMDPTHRLLLTASYEALVDAGLSKEAVKGRQVGVFVGASGGRGEPELSGTSSTEYSRPSVYDATGYTLSVASGRISYVLGLQGPCMTIDTACSSSLVALHSARRALQLGECDLAIVATCGLLSAQTSVALAVAGMTSPDGKCHTFDEGAIGFGRGEGCGAVVLKRMNDAERDGDRIYAVVKGSAVMQDGKSASLTAPNGLAQEQLLRSALADAGVDACDVSFLEAHGTGTKLGDPVETGAVASVYGAGRDESHPLCVSSVKGTLGHLEAASGMAGMLSAVLALHHEQAPPNAQLKKLNSKVAATVSEIPITFPFNATAAPLHRCRDGVPLLAAVSSFGFSGTIAHVLLEEPPVAQRREILHGCSRGSLNSNTAASASASAAAAWRG